MVFDLLTLCYSWSKAQSVNVNNTNKQYNPISKPSLGVILPSNRFSLMYSNVKSMFVERMYNWKVVWQVSSRNTCFTLWLLTYVTRNHENRAAPVTNHKKYFWQLNYMKLQTYTNYHVSSWLNLLKPKYSIVMFYFIDSLILWMFSTDP